jgi:hypothetical protein
MDVAKLEQLRADLLQGNFRKHRQLLITTGLLLVAFWAITIAVGYFAVNRWIEDEHVTVSKALNTPSQFGPLLTDHRRSDLVNSIVYLNRVKLEPGDADSLYFATDDQGNRMVVVSQSANAPSQNAVVSIMATIRPVSPALLKKWKLDKEEKKTIQAEGLYLEAESIKTKSGASETVARK